MKEPVKRKTSLYGGIGGGNSTEPKVSMSAAMRNTGLTDGEPTKKPPRSKVAPDRKHTNDSAMVGQNVAGESGGEKCFTGKIGDGILPSIENIEEKNDGWVKCPTVGEDLGAELDELGILPGRLATLTGTPEATVKGWLRGKGRPPGSIWSVILLLKANRRNLQVLEEAREAKPE